MEKQRRSFVNETPEQRRTALINATLDLIGETGFRSATMRSIADRADVTLGLIRHYFSSKEDLISAAYQNHMEQMTRNALEHDADEDLSAPERLATVIRASLSPPVLTERNVTLWATFLAQISNEAAIRETHDRTYLQFRNTLEQLISQALISEGREACAPTARRLAMVCNAIIDGLWLEGGAAPQTFDPGELASVALDSIGRVLEMDLTAKARSA